MRRQEESERGVETVGRILEPHVGSDGEVAGEAARLRFASSIDELVCKVARQRCHEHSSVQGYIRCPPVQQ
jgi:hypothetical protein